MSPKLVAVVLALGVTAAAGIGLEHVSPGPALGAALAALFLLLLPYFLWGLTEPRRPRSIVWVVALFVPYVLYLAGTGGPGSPLVAARLVAFVAIPTLLVHIARGRKGPGPLDLIAVLAIWLPFDLRLLEGIWTWPEGQGSYGFQTILAVDLAVFLFFVVRAIEGIGYRFLLTRRDALSVAVNFLLFSAIAIPLGLAIEFIRYQPRDSSAVELLATFFAILVFIGIPEELLFRGLIQNFLETWWGKGWRSLLLASVVFGAAHLDNDDAPNFAYALMATIAGVFYGRTFRQSGNLLAPALVHALVDTVWRAVFR
jgi:membrane protease YdiL (CAAX protease family)